MVRMAAGQLWLFDPPRPLVERLGEDFFRTLPTRPGVYLMCGAEEGVLYVGKARNLRKRLSSYRVANPERFARRTIRLLQRVRRIEWDECATEEAARCREELLICVLAPKFNAAGKVWPIARRESAQPPGTPFASAAPETGNRTPGASAHREARM
jgi:predicted GIY-YIG superfamily endonuclease